MITELIEDQRMRYIQSFYCIRMNLVIMFIYVMVIGVLMSSVAARPPRNVVEMKEGEVAKVDAGVPVEEEAKDAKPVVDGKLGVNLAPADGKLEVNLAPVDGKLEVKLAPVDGKLEVNLAPVDGKLGVNLAPVDGKLGVNLAPVDGKLGVNLAPVDGKLEVKLGPVDGKLAQDLLKKISGNKDNVLSVDKLLPAYHLDAVKLEQDGTINKDYKKEIFLGNHEEIDDDIYDIAESKIKDIFSKVDTDRDGKLSQAELESWILDKTQEHFDEALEENAHVFKHLDPDGDGFVEWKEYYVHFLLAKGFPLDQAAQHVEDYDVVDLQFDDREALIRYKFKWTDADTDPMDNRLTEKEFLAFRHPEQSDQALNNMLRTIIEALDQNDDGELSEAEFITLPLGDVDDPEHAKLDQEWQVERRREFTKQIDANHDGKATRDELKAYLDPRNPEQAKSDAASLVETMDNNGDGHISWGEILDHRDVFIQSKVINVKRILHDEF